MAPKRKAEGSTSSKKTKKTTSKSKNDSELLSLDQIQDLGDQIIDSFKVNNFVELLDQLKKVKTILESNEHVETESLGRNIAVILFKCFQKLLKDGQMINKKSNDEKKKVVAKWLLDKYSSFKKIIAEYIQGKLSFESSLQLDLLEINLNLIKLESQYLKSSSKDLYFPNVTYKELIEAIITSKAGEISSDGTSTNFIVLEFIEVFKKNWDLQFYFFNCLSDPLEEWKQTKSEDELRLIFSNVYTIIRTGLLFDSEKLEEQPTWIQGKLPSIAYKQSTFKAQYQKCIITILTYPLLSNQYKAILLVLHKRIIPYMTQPQGLMDFLTDSYDVADDSVVPILALNSLYELMKNYNLEYPDFYTKLYSLLTPELLYTRYRSRFFRLCDLFLSSTHLSASLVASFIKKLARLSIGSSASGVVIVIPFIYNLLKRHPTCMIMLHNIEGSKKKDYTDPYDNNEKNPMNTNAIGSSLWELETLMSHYHPNIATLAKIFGEPFRKHSYNMEDFLDWSYISLLESEKTRRYKTMAALEFEEFDRLFDSNDKKETDRALIEGWTI
ncbi:NOC4 [[Candida] subhashii]|uniref:NOC4 n=1 Tax=[Candida] subhashii TaxID=561895 RepID=A0A8J5UIX9_9ASCO|nr:NOC4 [[Candida] subhashii]KAG7661442.1 NOC4 [[Candida] subhashii]